MRNRPLAALASFFLLAVAVPAIAHADTTGSAGAVTKVEVNTPSADTYLQYHGRVYITAGKITTEYRWGGTSCGTKTLDADLVDVLMRAAADSNIVVTPSYLDGQGGSKCVVGFAVNPKR